ncbi:S-layer homology domain-containing protein [Patescibacteria group bacterium]
MKIRTLLFTAIFLLTSLSAQAYFTDIQKDSLDYFYEQGIFTGYEDGSFGPQNFLTRAELIKIVLEADRQELTATDLNCFSDITPEHWSAPYVCTAKDLEYINGYPDGSYKPDQEVNKVEAIKMIAEVLKWRINPELLMEEWESFTDVPESEWFYKYVANGVFWGFIDLNVQHLLDPGNSIVREDAAEILFRTLVSTKVNTRYGVKKLQTPGLDLLARDFFRAYENSKTLTREDFNQWLEFEGVEYAFDYEPVDGIENPKGSVGDPQYFFFLAKFNPEEDTPTAIDFYYPEGQLDGRYNCQHYYFGQVDQDGLIIQHQQAPQVCETYTVDLIWNFSNNLSFKSVD